jgi:hypothetical protein
VFGTEHSLHLWKRHSCTATVWRQPTDWRGQVTSWRYLRGLLYSHSDIVCLLNQPNCIELKPSVSVLVWVDWGDRGEQYDGCCVSCRQPVVSSPSKILHFVQVRNIVIFTKSIFTWWDFRVSWRQVWIWLFSGLLAPCCLVGYRRFRGASIIKFLMMEAASISETPMHFYQITWRNNPEESYLNFLWFA